MMYDVFVCNNRLEEEISSNQKLSQERLAAENRMKGLEEQITVHEDNISKVGCCVVCFS